MAQKDSTIFERDWEEVDAQHSTSRSFELRAAPFTPVSRINNTRQGQRYLTTVDFINPSACGGENP